MTPDDSGNLSSRLDDPLINLTGQQRALLSALREIDERYDDELSFANIYYGAIMAMKDSHNPESYAHCGHSIRELIEKLPRAFEIPVPHRSDNMGQRVNALKEKWEKVEESRNYSQGYDGDITQDLKKFLDGAEEFFKWVEENRLSRKQRAKEVIRKTDPLDSRIPATLEDIQAKTLQTFDRYFNGVSHHQFEPRGEEFLTWVERLEYFLLERLRPRTFDDYDKIDRIIGKK